MNKITECTQLPYHCLFTSKNKLLLPYKTALLLKLLFQILFYLFSLLIEKYNLFLPHSCCEAACNATTYITPIIINKSAQLPHIAVVAAQNNYVKLTNSYSPTATTHL